MGHREPMSIAQALRQIQDRRLILPAIQREYVWKPTTIKERQAEGIAIAKARGVYDRDPKLTETQIFTARELIAQGVPKAAVARELGVSRQTLYTALKGEGRYGTVRVDADQGQP